MGVSYLDLFTTFLKIGVLLFGGGYGGIGVIYRVVVEDKQWLTQEEFLRVLAIAESTPGPIALNSATWIGYKLGGIPGSILATVAVVIPPYLVILGIVFALSPYMEHRIARAVFRGINAAVVALILYAFLRLFTTAIARQGSLDPIALAVFIISIALLLALRLDPVYVIAIAALIGLASALIL